jgi:hypothetical protein
MRTTVHHFGKRHDCVFDFARYLRGIPALAQANLEELKAYHDRWFNHNKRRFEAPYHESWWDFCEGWENVHFPKGRGPMMQIVDKARAAALPACGQKYGSEDLRLFVKVCRELQRAAGSGPFFLTVRALEEAGIPRSRVHSWLRGLARDGVLLPVSKGRYNTHRGSEFRYIGGD